MKPGKHQRLQELYRPVHDQFERFCRVRVYGEMDHRDLMNESLLVAHDKLENLRSEDAFLSFLFGIAIRILNKQHRKRKELKTEDHPNLIQHQAENRTDGNADVHFLYQALAQLPENQREAVILFEVNGFSIKEIASMQEASVSAVKKRLERGRSQLLRLLADPSAPERKEVTHG